jgi:AraC family transcriptional regulator of adaptative response/methylated-DNA-[protein]-cysteine methyltransferase
MTMSAGKITDILSGRQWQQVLERDAQADGKFFYAVQSTGIVCRPTCPSRRPVRTNVAPADDAIRNEQRRHLILRPEP